MRYLLLILVAIFAISLWGCESDTEPIIQGGGRTPISGSSGFSPDPVSDPDPVPKSLKVGDRVIVQNVNPIGLNVRLQPHTDAQKLDKVFNGDTGVIDDKPDDPKVVDDRYTWWFIKWDNGKSGWSAEADIDGTVWIKHE